MWGGMSVQRKHTVVTRANSRSSNGTPAARRAMRATCARALSVKYVRRAGEAADILNSDCEARFSGYLELRKSIPRGRLMKEVEGRSGCLRYNWYQAVPQVAMGATVCSKLQVGAALLRGGSGHRACHTTTCVLQLYRLSSSSSECIRMPAAASEPRWLPSASSSAPASS